MFYTESLWFRLSDGLPMAMYFSPSSDERINASYKRILAILNPNYMSSHYIVIRYTDFTFWILQIVAILAEFSLVVPVGSRSRCFPGKKDLSEVWRSFAVGAA